MNVSRITKISRTTTSPIQTGLVVRFATGIDPSASISWISGDKDGLFKGFWLSAPWSASGQMEQLRSWSSLRALRKLRQTIGSVHLVLAR